MGKEVNQIRATAWIDKEVYEEFRKLHPAQGAITKFIRRAMEVHIRKMKGVGLEIIKEIEGGS